MNPQPGSRRALTVEQMEARDVPSTSHLDSIVPLLPPGATAANQFIVTLQPGVDAEQFAAELRGQGREVLRVYSHAVNGLAFRGAALENDPRVAFIEPDQIAHVLGKPSSGGTQPAASVPTGVQRIGGGVPLAADLSEALSNVNIAIIDTGIDVSGVNATHPDLNVVGGVNFTNAKSWNDDNGHGSHVAGTAAAIDNGIGVVGVAPGAPLWAVKVLDRQGSGWLSDIIAGVDWVTKTRTDTLADGTTLNTANDIAVANMSLGGISHNATYHKAIQNSVSAGVVYVVAAGNDGRNIYGTDGIPYSDDNVMAGADDSTPASFPEVIAVSALADSDGTSGGAGDATGYGADDTLATFSNWGGPVGTAPGVEIAAPGVDIYSTYKGGGYATMSGTSMASPHVAGAVALHIAQQGGKLKDINSDGKVDNYEVDAVRKALVGTAQPMAEWGSAAISSDKDPAHEGLVYVVGRNVAVGIQPALVDGTTYTVTVEVTNLGAIGLPSFTVALFHNNKMVHTEPVYNLIPTQAQTVTFTLSAGPGDVLRAEAWTAFEIDPLDNVASLTI